MRCPARATLANPRFQSLCELGKRLKYNSLRPTFKSPRFEFKNELEKCYDPNLRFTVENKGNLHKIRPVTFKLNIMNEIFIFLNFKYLAIKMN